MSYDEEPFYVPMNMQFARRAYENLKREWGPALDAWIAAVRGRETVEEASPARFVSREQSAPALQAMHTLYGRYDAEHGGERTCGTCCFRQKDFASRWDVYRCTRSASPRTRWLAGWQACGLHAL